jgi:hypothetical protein
MDVWVISDSRGDVLEVFDSKEGAVNYLIGCLKETAMDDNEKWKNFINFYDSYMLEDDDLAVHLSDGYIIYAEKKTVIKQKYIL